MDKLVFLLCGGSDDAHSGNFKHYCLIEVTDFYHFKLSNIICRCFPFTNPYGELRYKNNFKNY